MDTQAIALKSRHLVGIFNMFYLLDETFEQCVPNADIVTHPEEWIKRSDYSDEYGRAHQFMLRVLGAGFEYVGAGCFGVVVRHPDTPGVVYKCTARLNDAYTAYALWARTQQNDPHVPKIYGFDTHEHGAVVVLEELQEFYLHYDSVHDAGVDTTYAHRVSRVEEAPETGINATLYNIGLYFAGVAQLDLHSGNLMCRADGTIVVTDPVSYFRK